jgi:hypothetical protein
MKNLLILFLLGVAGLATAETAFPDRYVTNGLTLDLKGTARMKIGGLISLYDAALYMPADVPAERVLDDVPKRLELIYLKTMSKAVLLEAGAKGLASNVPPARLQALQPKIDQINQWYQTVKPRDVYTLTYRPGAGTELAFNGARQGVVEGADFAAAYYTIWLGTNAPRPEVRDALLGRPRK